MEASVSLPAVDGTSTSCPTSVAARTNWSPVRLEANVSKELCSSCVAATWENCAIWATIWVESIGLVGSWLVIWVTMSLRKSDWLSVCCCSWPVDDDDDDDEDEELLPLTASTMGIPYLPRSSVFCMSCLALFMTSTLF